MKTLYIECKMGIAGDMLLAALLDLHPSPQTWIDNFNKLGIPDVKVSLHSSEKCGITGKSVRVRMGYGEEGDHGLQSRGHDPLKATHQGHHGRSFQEIKQILEGLSVSDKAKKDTLSIYALIAKAEGKVHGQEVNEVHFHEIGMMDAVVDILGVALLMEELSPDRILASPVHLGGGHVHCAHGILPVPAPATAILLKGIPSYGGDLQGELCTPTGAALLNYYAEAFGPMPEMVLEGLGYGMGKKDFPFANCVRLFLGKSQDFTEEILELVCSLDDVTGEELAFAKEILLEEGALDVYSRSILMKKGRPGHELVCLCTTEQEEKMARLMLKHTPTLGLRVFPCRRHKLESKVIQHESSLGLVREKVSTGFGIEKMKVEYEDLASLSKKQDLSFYEVRRLLEKEKSS